MTTLEQMEPKIVILSRVWCFEQRELVEDLQQEARLAVWRALQQQPNSHAAFLKRVAEYAMLHYRKRGRSVDNLLDPRRRSVHWQAVSVDYVPPDGQQPLEDTLTSAPFHAHNVWQSPTEDEAVGHLLCEMLRTVMTPREDAVLLLLLEGYTSSEAGHRLGIPHCSSWRAMKRLQRKAREVLGLEYEGMGR